jgi:hypothetical protein
VFRGHQEDPLKERHDESSEVLKVLEELIDSVGIGAIGGFLKHIGCSMREYGDIMGFRTETFKIVLLFEKHTAQKNKVFFLLPNITKFFVIISNFWFM